MQRISIDVEVDGNKWEFSIHNPKMDTQPQPAPSRPSPSTKAPKLHVPLQTEQPPLSSNASESSTPTFTFDAFAPVSIPGGFRITTDPTPQHFALNTTAGQRSTSTPSIFPVPETQKEIPKETEQKEDPSSLTAFQQWLSLFPEHTIPMPFREALS